MTVSSPLSHLSFYLYPHLCILLPFIPIPLAALTPTDLKTNQIPILTHFYPEDGGDTFLRNTANYLPDYTASQPRILKYLYLRHL
jgi:hypothetical protein